MKKIASVILLITLIGQIGFSQTTELSDALEVKAKNFSPILSNGEVKGYCVFYELDKIDEKQKLYRISFLDNALKIASSSDFMESNDLSYASTSFNGKSILIQFFDAKKKNMVLRRFTVRGEEIAREEHELGSQMETIMLQYMANKSMNLPDILYSIKKKGYVYYTYEPNDSKGLGMLKSKYAIKYFPEDESEKAWIVTGESEYKGLESASFLFEANGLLVNNVVRKKKMISNKGMENFIHVIDVKTGKKLFEIKTESKKYKSLIYKGLINAETGNIEVFGTYYNIKDEMMKSYSLGFANLIYNKKGELISEKYNSWKEDVVKLLPVGKKDKVGEGYYTFVHQILRDNNDNIFIIGEQYKPTFTGFDAKIAVQDLMILKLNKEFELESASIFEKNKTMIDLGNIAATSSPVIMGYMIYAFNGFDFSFSQVNNKTGEISVIYSDEGKNVQTIGTITHRDGKFDVRKKSIDSKSKKIAVFKAKSGSVLLFERSTSGQGASLRVEKLD
tara:strand:+ start:3915 stop:5429 length:1515 start_codon:yes stop_codon:yes gene_type:complete